MCSSDLESEKATFEINAEQAGVLKTVAAEGETLKIGDIACKIDETAAAPAGAKETSKAETSKPAEKAEESSLDTMEDASRVMRRGLAGQRPTQRMTNAPLDKLKADRKEREFNEARKAAAEERRNTARSTTSAVPYSSISPFKKGGMAKSASARADGCAIRGKTRA